MTGLNGFNRIARIYDPLKRLVFGEALAKGQLHFLSLVPIDATVLILGGGTGETLLPLLTKDSSRRIVYVEASSEMLSLAKRRIASGDERITFLHGTLDSLPSGLVFDAIITHFFLDLFPDDETAGLCRRLESMLSDKGMWLVSDFIRTDSWWHIFLLRSMYRFFNLTANVAAKSLPAWEDHLRHANLIEAASAYYYGGFVKTGVFRKSQAAFS